MEHEAQRALGRKREELVELRSPIVEGVLDPVLVPVGVQRIEAVVAQRHPQMHIVPGVSGDRRILDEVRDVPQGPEGIGEGALTLGGRPRRERGEEPLPRERPAPRPAALRSFLEDLLAPQDRRHAELHARVRRVDRETGQVPRRQGIVEVMAHAPERPVLFAGAVADHIYDSCPRGTVADKRLASLRETEVAYQSFVKAHRQLGSA